jgi:hypothetical protein
MISVLVEHVQALTRFAITCLTPDTDPELDEWQPRRDDGSSGLSHST